MSSMHVLVALPWIAADRYPWSSELQGGDEPLRQLEIQEEVQVCTWWQQPFWRRAAHMLGPWPAVMRAAEGQPCPRVNIYSIDFLTLPPPDSVLFRSRWRPCPSVLTVRSGTQICR
jgi:hypothetical protein